ncbi:MAG: hypothetical protein R2725_10675 [Solirubrobacterales bacterium]
MQVRELGLEPDPQGDYRREEARILMLRVGLALLDDARRHGGFETDEATMDELVRSILISLGAPDANGDEVQVTAFPNGRDRVTLSVPTGKGTILGAALLSDGVLLEEYGSSGIPAEGVGTAAIPQGQPEQLRRERAEQEIRTQSAVRFRGERLLRVLTADPQPESAVQFLAVEWFSDGLVVHYSYDEGLDPSDFMMAGGRPGRLGWSSGVLVEDDLGTKYSENGAGASGAGAIHATAVFVPAVPEDARMLLLTCPHGAVEIGL